MNVTREIVKDLLPLYVAGEASAESCAAVEEWLRTDAELARMAAALRDEEGRAAAIGPAPGSGHAALLETKALLRRRSLLLGLALLFTGLPLSFTFDGTGLHFFMLRDAPAMAVTSAALGLGLWVAFAAVTRRLRVTGL